MEKGDKVLILDPKSTGVDKGISVMATRALIGHIGEVKGSLNHVTYGDLVEVSFQGKKGRTDWYFEKENVLPIKYINQ